MPFSIMPTSHTTNQLALCPTAKQCGRLKLEMEDILYTMNEGQSGISGNELKWYETAKKLNDTLLEIDKNLQKDEIIEWIERAQKLPKTPKNVKTHDKSGKRRKVVAKFESWKQSEKVKQIIIKYNREHKDPQNAIYVDQLYFQRNDRKNEQCKNVST